MCTMDEITTAAKNVIGRIYETSQVRDGDHLHQMHGMARGMIILWSELAFMSGGGHTARAAVQAEMEALIKNHNDAARRKLGLPVLPI
jgi:hypothetical protein